jgi:aminoglycoside 3-N-acetyltransferase I
VAKRAGLMSSTILRISQDNAELMDGLLDLFATEFDDADSYSTKRPSPAYLRRLLGKETFIALVAVEGDRVVGGLAAYVLEKFEQERSEVYIYDLAVAEAFRRRGIATGLIASLQQTSAEMGAYVVMVQADLVDEPAVALYTKLGVREDVLHFDIVVPPL